MKGFPKGRVGTRPPPFIWQHAAAWREQELLRRTWRGWGSLRSHPQEFFFRAAVALLFFPQAHAAYDPSISGRGQELWGMRDSGAAVLALIWSPCPHFWTRGWGEAPGRMIHEMKGTTRCVSSLGPARHPYWLDISLTVAEELCVHKPRRLGAGFWGRFQQCGLQGRPGRKR